MMRRLKKRIVIPIVLIALVVLLPLLAYLPPVQRVVIDYAEKWVDEHTPMTLSVEHFSLKFPLRVALYDVVVTTADSDTMVVAKELQADVAILPILAKRVVVRNISLHDASIDYVTPDNTIDVEAAIGKVALLDGKIIMTDNHVQVGKILLENSDVDFTYCAMPDTADQDTSGALAWDIEIEHLQLASVNVDALLPGVIDTLQVGIGNAHLVDGDILLLQQKIEVHSLEIEQGEYRYVNIQSNDAPKETDEDINEDTSSLPWEVRVHRIKLSDNSAAYITSAQPPATGMDFSHIDASRINLFVHDVYNRGGELYLSLDTLSAYERSGLYITQAQCDFSMSGEGLMSLSDFKLKTPFSDIEADAMLDMSLFERNPDAVIQLLGKAHLSCRDIAYIYPDASQYYIHSARGGALMPVNEIITADIDVNGVAKDMNVGKLNLSQMGVFTLKSHAHIAHPLDKERRNVTLSCSMKTAGQFALDNYLSDSIMARRLVDQPIAVNVNAHLMGSDMNADAILYYMGGNVDVDATYNIAEERYSVDAQINKFPLDLFMPNDAIGALTAHAEVKGAHFAPEKPETSLYAQLNLDTLVYRDYLYRNIDIKAQAAEQKWSMDATSGLEDLNLNIAAQGTFMSDFFTANMSAQIGKVDLQALHFSEQPFDITTDIKADIVLSSIDSIIQTDISIGELEFSMDEYRYHSNPISLLAASDITYSYIGLYTGDMEVNLSSDTGIKNLQPSFERLTQLLDTIFMKQRLDMEELHRGLPPFEFVAQMKGDNIVQRFLNSKGIRFSNFNLEANNDSLFNLSGDVRRLEIAGMMLDTITIEAYEKQERLNYRLAMGNRPGNMDELAHMRIEGFLSGNSTRLYCLQKNRQDETGFLFGCKIDFLGDLVRLTFGPNEPIIGYKKWLLNKDNFLSINHAQHALDANLQLSYDNSHLFVTTEDRRNKDVSGVHVDVKNIELADWLTVSSLFVPMSGNMSADFYVDMPPKGVEAVGVLDVEEYKYNNTRIGSLHAEVEYILDKNGGNDARLLLLHDSHDVLELTAYLGGGDTKKIDGEIIIDQLPLSIANAFLSPKMGSFDGELNSKLTVLGTLNEPLVNGYLRFDKSSMQFNQFGASLALSDDKVKIVNSRLLFDKYYIKGLNNNHLNINGTVDFERLNDIAVSLTMQGNNFQPIGIEENRSSIIYGSVFTDVDVRVRGHLNDLKVTGGISLLSGTNATYVMQSNSSLSSTDYSDMVSFVSFADTVSVKKKNEKIAKRTNNFTATIGIDIDDGVQLGVNLSVDGKNRVDLVGGGELLYTATALGDNRVSGRYNLNGGFVRYTPPIISQKIFNIQDGSYVSWNGEMLDPLFNITAIQSQRSSVKTGDESRLVDFEIAIKLSNTLKNLDISFDLSTVDDITIDNELKSLTAEQREAKALNMLLYNSYTDLASAVDNYSINNPLNAFLEYELNTWAQRTLRGVDLTFGIDNYGIDGTGTQRTDYSYQFSKSLFDNRLKVVVGGSYASNQDVTKNLSENLIDDISLEYRLDKRESMYLKAFRQKGYESIVEGEITQTGVGFMYRKQVASFLDFFRRKTPKEKQPQESTPADSVVNINYTPVPNAMLPVPQQQEEIEP